MKPAIAVLGAVWSDEVLARLDEQFNCHKLARMPAAQRARFMETDAGAVRAILTTGTVGIDAALAAAFPALEIVSVHGAGLDAVDLDGLAARGIVVTNTPDVLTDDVADFAVGLLLAAVRRIPLLDQYVRAGHWVEKRPLLPARSLTGKVAGIYGYGRIGQAVGMRLRAFGMHLRYYQRSAGPEPAMRAASLLELAQQSDVLVACTPGGAQTRHALDAAVLAALGPQGTVVNIARGSVVDARALAELLATGRLGAAALDVFEEEPDVPAALLALDNVVLTPHVGSFTVEARRAMAELAVANLSAWFGGKPPLTPVAHPA
ncbi:2-hydroxyacid dehydrogenase [Massilia consociata]|uniref:2-hydroxyacid dehydrogenase n=1 Tax=Massilia consociata TaxID=760117 RepID=A0ABV6FF34_9BURK